MTNTIEIPIKSKITASDKSAVELSETCLSLLTILIKLDDENPYLKLQWKNNFEVPVYAAPSSDVDPSKQYDSQLNGPMKVFNYEKLNDANQKFECTVLPIVKVNVEDKNNQLTYVHAVENQMVEPASETSLSDTESSTDNGRKIKPKKDSHAFLDKKDPKRKNGNHEQLRDDFQFQAVEKSLHKDQIEVKSNGEAEITSRLKTSTKFTVENEIIPKR